MKRNILLVAALLGAMVWTNCTKVEEELIEDIPEEPVVEAVDSVWTVTIQAVKKEAPETKGLAIEGEETTTTVLKSIWKDGEAVKVFLGTEFIGTLSATPDGEDAHKAHFQGQSPLLDLLRARAFLPC